eukprot:TRINITY_DN803_c0_g1_i1.p4 TRINITY_DN803_c0_g1~~TRINITY_DN803_c0_g1_i1.p4  ORF type:complete len:102 (-),score=16.62 TRINITY_DN803_c0_g1_i1:169-474(-)
MKDLCAPRRVVSRRRAPHDSGILRHGDTVHCAVSKHRSAMAVFYLATDAPLKVRGTATFNSALRKCTVSGAVGSAHPTADVRRVAAAAPTFFCSATLRRAE